MCLDIIEHKLKQVSRSHYKLAYPIQFSRKYLNVCTFQGHKLFNDHLYFYVIQRIKKNSITLKLRFMLCGKSKIDIEMFGRLTIAHISDKETRTRIICVWWLMVQCLCTPLMLKLIHPRFCLASARLLLFSYFPFVLGFGPLAFLNFLWITSRFTESRFILGQDWDMMSL